MDHRTQRVLAKSAPFTLRQLENEEARVFHLGTLLADDFTPKTVEYLATKGDVSIDVQGYLRTVKGEEVLSVEWTDKKENSTRRLLIPLVILWMPQAVATPIAPVTSMPALAT